MASKPPSSHAGSPSDAARSLTTRISSSEPARRPTSSTALAADGVQSLLLEGGPRLAAAFLREDLIDKLLVFVAPKIAGEGPRLFEGEIPQRPLSRSEARPVGEDVLLSAYVHEP